MKTISFILLAAMLGAAAQAADPAPAQGGTAELRRVWVLAQPGQAAFPGSVLPSDGAKVLAYDLTCEDGRVQRAERTYLVERPVATGRVWVVRTDNLDAGTASLQRALDAVCQA
jgi:hypothetical protein